MNVLPIYFSIIAAESFDVRTESSTVQDRVLPIYFCIIAAESFDVRTESSTGQSILIPLLCVVINKSIVLWSRELLNLRSSVTDRCAVESKSPTGYFEGLFGAPHISLMTCSLEIGFNGRVNDECVTTGREQPVANALRDSPLANWRANYRGCQRLQRYDLVSDIGNTTCFNPYRWFFRIVMESRKSRLCGQSMFAKERSAELRKQNRPLLRNG
ncbi:hypothetical protein C0J52_24231 [Blattella germanica]|nr:hypothetical protein C0J52_24231 [Blattella germanica]